MEDRRDRLRPWYNGVAIILCFIALWIIFTDAGDTKEVIRTKDPVPTTVTIALGPMPTVDVITTEPVVATVGAIRIDPPEPPPPSAAEICNGLTYDYEEMLNPMICLHAVEVEQGVSQTDIDTADSWFYNLIDAESGGCPFVRGGDRDIPVGCIVLKPGHSDDVGFGQATHSYYGPGGKLCVNLGICNSAQILQDPYHSMLYSVIWPSIFDGAYGWCYYTDPKTGKHPTWHNCSLVPWPGEDWRLHATAPT